MERLPSGLAGAPSRLGPAPAPDPYDDGRPLQDRLPVHCFGCGTLNARGLHIKSRWAGDAFVCTWQSGPEHVGYPGRVYGGTIASVVDCHAVWASLACYCREANHDLNSGPPPFGVVTGRLRVDYLAPASVVRPLELHARVVERSERTILVACTVRQGSLVCATAEVVTVRVKVEG